MLRVTESIVEGKPVLRLEGRISDAWLAEVVGVVESWERRAGESPPLLDLAGVSWMDRDGVRLLRRLIDLGAPVRGASPFIRQLLTLEKSGG